MLQLLFHSGNYEGLMTALTAQQAAAKGGHGCSFVKCICRAFMLLQEAKDREWRNKEQAAAARQAAMMNDLAAARETQMRRKVMAQATMAEVEQAEFRRVLEVDREKQMQDMSQVRGTHVCQTCMCG